MLDYFEEAFAARHGKPVTPSLKTQYQREHVRVPDARAFTRSGVEGVTS
jgi:hypothetical protein